MIAAEPREPRIVVVTRGGVATKANQDIPQEKPQVRHVAQKKVPFDVQKLKQGFLDVLPEFVDQEQSSTSIEITNMPECFQQLFKK